MCLPDASTDVVKGSNCSAHQNTVAHSYGTSMDSTNKLKDDSADFEAFGTAYS